MNHIDVLIIAALPVEFEAAREAGLASGSGRTGIERWDERDTGQPVPYLVGEFRSSGGDRFSVALARPTRMGGWTTGPVAADLASRLRPACLAMCGVCAGNPARVALGDVIVAELAYPYDEGKQTVVGFEGDHRQSPLDVRLLRAAQELDVSGLPSYGPATDHEAMIWFLERLRAGQEPRTHPARDRYFPRGTWESGLAGIHAQGLIEEHEDRWALTERGRRFIERRLYHDVDGPERLPFAVVVGPMASGNVVAKDGAGWDRLAAMGVRTVAGLEMEAAAIATVAYQQQLRHWLVTKGVMDHADPAKDDRYKRFAARASADVLYRLLDGLAPASDVSAVDTPVRLTGAVRLEVCRRLHADWRDAADVAEVPAYERARWSPGREPGELWDWLEVRDRLGELPEVLDRIGRPELAALLRSTPNAS
jgi:nucleoside phosphorylase